MSPVRPWFLLLLALCAHGNRAGAQKLVTRESQIATADFADFVHFVHSLQSPRSPATPPRNVDDFLLFAPSLVETTHVDTLPKQAWKKGGKNFPLHEPQCQYTDQEAHRATGSSEEGFVAAWIGAMSSLGRSIQTTMELVEDAYSSEAGQVENFLSVAKSHVVFDNQSLLAVLSETYENYTLSEELVKTSSVSIFTETIEYRQGEQPPSRIQFVKSLQVNNREDVEEYTSGSDQPSVLAALESALNTKGLSCELIRCQSEGEPIVYFAHVQLMANAVEEQLRRIEALKGED